MNEIFEIMSEALAKIYPLLTDKDKENIKKDGYYVACKSEDEEYDVYYLRLGNMRMKMDGDSDWFKEVKIEVDNKK